MQSELKNALAQYLIIWFSPSQGEIKKLVREYVAKNRINAPQFKSRIPVEEPSQKKQT